MSLTTSAEHEVSLALSAVSDQKESAVASDLIGQSAQ